MKPCCAAAVAEERKRWQDALFPGKKQVDLRRVGATPEGAAVLVRAIVVAASLRVPK